MPCPSPWARSSAVTGARSSWLPTDCSRPQKGPPSCRWEGPRPGVAPARISRLNEETGGSFREAENHFEAQSTQDALVALSGAAKVLAVSLTKICNDLRWMGSGPRAGLGEIHL